MYVWLNLKVVEFYLIESANSLCSKQATGWNIPWSPKAGLHNLQTVQWHSLSNNFTNLN